MNKDLKARIASVKEQKRKATAATFKDKLNKLLSNFIVKPTKDGTGSSYLIVANEDGQIVSAGYYDSQLAVQSTIQLLGLVCCVIDDDGEPQTHLSPEQLSSLLLAATARDKILNNVKDDSDESTLH